jgi:leader peptidase (prepilin peptidase)/N-methyltransferase
VIEPIDWMRDWPALLGVLYLLAVAAPLTRIDIRERRLPNKYVVPAFAVALVGQAVASALGASLIRLPVAIGLAIVLLALGVAANLRFDFGMGDVKLISAMALSLGWFDPLLPLLALFLASVAASVWVGARVVFAGASLKGSIALGPYLLLGFAASSTMIIFG